MRLLRNAAFEEERARFGLRFCCEDCGHFDDADGRCRHDWPTELHRRARYASDPNSVSGASDVVFCKEFELC
ncbi:MAG TPA: hypothetical protein VFF06_30930 [Polyangia bacterium]|nr:hypothetical protein [Polyangia bacterium]